MGVIDKLRAIHEEPADRDLLEFLGVGPDRFSLAGGVLTVGDETVTLAQAKAALAAGRDDTPRRTVRIEDLPPAPLAVVALAADGPALPDGPDEVEGQEQPARQDAQEGEPQV